MIACRGRRVATVVAGAGPSRADVAELTARWAGVRGVVGAEALRRTPPLAREGTWPKLAEWTPVQTGGFLTMRAAISLCAIACRRFAALASRL